MSTSLDVSGKIDKDTVELFRTVDKLIQQLAIPYVVIGATARDIVLHYGYGAGVERATQDVDFAIEVATWAAFDALKQKLVETGFELTREQHRLTSPSGAVVDIVPFGEVEGEQGSIAWPPKGDVVMSVLGFQEACDHATKVRIDDIPELVVPIATPEGMVLLKLIAWTDRARDKRGKDALDLAYILSSYESIPKVRDVLYSSDDSTIMERYGWDITLAAAYLLGREADSIAVEQTRAEIRQLIDGNMRDCSMDQLITEMCGSQVTTRYERNKRNLDAFWAGFSSLE
jgi:predicted nucleotidyltransferase